MSRSCRSGTGSRSGSGSGGIGWLAGAALVLAVSTSAAQAPGAGKFGLGKSATPEEIAGWDIDVKPDGTGLPRGRGSVAEGQAIYDAKCASCHGTFGESNSYLQIAGGVGTLASDSPIRTTGSKLNYATTLFDYIRRAMPFNAPQSLTADEVYALTAYVLNLNDIVGADAVLDQDSLPKLRLPNRDGLTTAHGFMRRDGKPDTANVACMKNCVGEVRLSSEMPAYALDQHGNLADQRRAMGAIEGLTTVAVATATSKPATNAVTGLDLAKRFGCMACHAVDAKLVGPAFHDVAARYGRPPQPDAEARLVAKLKSGGSGVWGDVAMPAQPQVSAADARTIVQWILGGK
ncbi:MAG TPA: c-type cytochrome [Casimicrobiaceae bacterium]|nr:c-type cytochrome [Casimicrobiaceae bacterium]